MASKSKSRPSTKKRVNETYESDSEDVICEGVRELTAQEIMSRASIQKEEDRQKIREEYRTLQEELQQRADGAGEGGLQLDDIKTYILKSNSVFESVKFTREACIDSQLLRTCGALMKINIESAQTGLSVFRPVEFAQKMIHFMTPESADETVEPDEEAWRHFGTSIAPLYKRSLGVESLYASLDYEKPATQRQPRKQLDKNVGQRKEPEKIDTALLDDEANQEEVVRILGILRRAYRDNNKQAVNYYKFVTNPESYTYTVENMFHVSFLIRDQHAQIILNKDGIPVLFPRKSTADAVDGNDAKQCILTLTMAEWRELITVFKIKHSMIPSPTLNNNKRTLPQGE